MNRRVRSLLAQGIATKIHWLPGHSGIPADEDADFQTNLARDARGSTVKEQPYNLTSNRAKQISETRLVVKLERKANKCSKHISCRLKGKAGTERLIPLTSVKSLAARVYQLMCGQAATGVYLKRFSHRDVDKCWLCGGTVSQTRDHLFHHCILWRDHQSEL